MSAILSDFRIYGCANMPEADSLTVGGAIDFTKRLEFEGTAISPTTLFDAVSSSLQDVNTKIIYNGRDSTGVIQTETLTLNGQTKVAGTKTLERLLYALLSLSASAFGITTPGTQTTTLTNAGGINASVTSMTVASATGFPGSGNYDILVDTEYMTVTAGQGTGTWTITRAARGSTAATHAQNAVVSLPIQGDVALIAHTLTISAHTMQAGSAQATTTAPAIAKLQSGDGASCSPGMVLRTTGGTGPQQIRRILAVNPLGLGADIVAVDRNWGTLPDATTTYEVGHGFHFEFAASNDGVALNAAQTQVLAITRAFATAAADVQGGSTRNFYEKGFVVNNGQTFALQSVAEILQSIAPALPGTAALNFALTSALNDTGTVANRQTAPASGITSFSSGAPPQTINVPAPGNLAASTASGSATSAQGIWWNLNLPAGTAAWEGVITERTQGSST